MFSRIEPNSTTGGGRVLARQLARELTRKELLLVGGGGTYTCSHTANSSTQPPMSGGQGDYDYQEDWCSNPAVGPISDG